MSRFSGYRTFAARTAEGKSMTVLRWIVIPILCVHVTLAIISGYRAIVQIYSLDIRLPQTTLRAGSTVGFKVVSSGRAGGRARIELVQGTRVETLAVRLLRRNWIAGYDPRPFRDSVFVTITPELLNRFEDGAARLRATAIGAPQWMRTPPPTVREAAVSLAR